MLREKSLCLVFLLVLSIEQIVGPPAVIKNKHDGETEKDHDIKTNEVDDMTQNEDFKVEYQRYLNEVVKTLETDEEFKKKIETSNQEDITSGKISKELDMVSHNIRSKLDELKRQEVQRLRDLIKKKEELGHKPIHPSEYEHIDHLNLDTFEVKDLDNLIKKVSKDMEKLNEMRAEEFKQYELEKHFEEEMKIKNMTEKDAEEYKHQLEELKKKHANHEKIHHPGSKAQLEEVWDKQDHLENQDFDPRIFFRLHDIDGNGYWDHEEVKALFIKELDKMYQAGLPEDDMRERAEEMERMREHVFKEMDKNGDNLISYDEYMNETKTKEFNQDEGWDTLDKKQIYTQKEYEEFERQRIAEIQRLIDQGMLPPDQYPGMYHPNQVPVGHPNQVPQYHQQGPQYHPNQMPQQPYHPNQVPQHPNQVPQHPNQVPQHPNQYPNNAPVQPNQQQMYHPNQHPNQVPQQQYHPNQQYQGQQQGQVQQQQAYQHNSPQYQNNQQQQYHPNPNPNNQAQYQQQNSQQQYQPNQQQYQNQPQYQQQNQNNQPQYQQQNQNNQPQYQQQQQNNQPSQQQQNQNNQPHQQQNQNSQQQQQQQQNHGGQPNQPTQQSNHPQPPASGH